MKINLKRQAYKRTLVGFTSALYDGVVYRNKLRGLGCPEFSLQDFREWFFNLGGKEKHQVWSEYGFSRNLKPSIDRIDPRVGYKFSNMQILTVPENMAKGEKEKELLWGKETEQLSKNGEILAIFHSAKAASISVGGRMKLLQQAVRRGHLYKGYKWRYKTSLKHRTLKAVSLEN